MTVQDANRTALSLQPSRLLPLLLLLFVGSGCSALIYEIVWLQLLQLSIGSSAVSLAVLLATFMGGMSVGSIALPTIVSPKRHPLLVYALIEFGIGFCAVAILFGMPYIDRLYLSMAGWGLPGVMPRAVLSAACLTPPTLLMGASLPAISRWIETTPRGVSWLGFFYGGNIAGAVLGCLLAGFYLLRAHDVAVATLAAVAINVAVALGSAVLALFAPHRRPADSPARSRTALAAGSWQVLTAIAFSGLCALGAEVTWTRLLSLRLGATVYTFSIILAVFLFGLGIGSGAGARLARRFTSPRMALGGCQLLLTAAIAWTACFLAWSLPFHDMGPSSSVWSRFPIDVGRCLAAMLPAACLWGASFPLALAALSRRGQDPGRLVGRAYAANTTGAILGSLLFGLLLIPGAGTRQSQRILIAASAVAALFALLPALRRCTRHPLLLIAAITIVSLFAWSVPATPWGVVAYGRRLADRSIPGKLRYMGEGMNASVAISELAGTLRFHVSGKVEASTDQQDMRLQRMLGHIPALLHPEPRTVLVVGCGAGVTAGSFVVHPEVRRIVICEIEPLIPPAAARHFGRENHDVLRDKRTEVVYDDARHYVLTTPDRFDVITSDPIHPWVKGSATLYTREYFEMCKRHLNPGGFVTQWVPLYESTLDTVKSEIATFFDVFPNGTIWGNDTAFMEGYDVVLLGQAGDLRIDVDELQRRLDRPDHSSVTKSLREVAFGRAVSLLGTYAGRGPDLRKWLSAAQINRDRNLRLQYLAGVGMDSRSAVFIYDQILSYRRFPRDVFRTSPDSGKALRTAMGPP